MAFANLGSIIEDMHKRGAVVLLVGIRINQFVGNFDAQFAALQKKYNTAYVPNVLGGVFGNPAYMTDDGIHPNDKGYAIIASRIAPALQKLLQ
jgi:lysophospholipase L1-like esterase